MAYFITPDLGLELADPLTIQPFETPNVNSNFLLLEAGIVADRVRLLALETDVETLQDRVTVRVADFTALAAAATGELLSGDLAYVTEGRVIMAWSGSTWFQVTTATFASAAARDTAYAKASAAYRVAGAKSALTSIPDNEFVYTGSAWVPASPGAIAIRVVRASNTPALSTAYVDLSASANWSTATPAAQNRGFAAYSNGITIPTTGVYRVGYSLASSASFLAGVTINKNTAVSFADFEVIASADPVQNVSAMAASEEVRLAANDVLRLYAIAASGTPALSASVGSFYCEWVRPQ